MNRIKKYFLAPDVFFQKTPNDDVVLYQTTKQQIYLLDNNIYPFLCALKNQRDGIDEAKERFLLYDNAQMLDTVKQMIDMGWILTENVLEERTNTLEAALKIGQYETSHSLSDVQFELTFRCNEHCKHCYCPRDNKKEKELKIDEIKKILNDLHEMRVVTVTFTGGELFLRDDTFEILEYAYKLGFVINIFTNGTLLKDDDFFRLKKIYPRSVHFSLYNYIPEKHDNFTHLPGSFNKTVSAIKKCKLLGIPVNVKVSLVEDNYNDIDGICDLVEKLGASIQISMQISPKNDGGMEPTLLRLNDAEKYSAIMQRVDNHILLSCAGDFIHFEHQDNNKVCGAGSFSLNINPYGEVYPCNALLLSCGNVRKQSIRDIWGSSEMLKKIRNFKFDQIKGCEKCENKTKCDFCPGSAMQETGDPLIRYSEACIITRAKIIKTKGETK